MHPVPRRDFEILVGEAIDSMPEDVLALLDNVVVLVEDQAVEEDLLGLYEGVPLTERSEYGGLAMPDRVFLYRLPLCAISSSRDELVEEIRVTVIHELAHHVGIDDDRLDELGWA